MPQRSLYYWSKIYYEQLEVSEKYSKLQKTICINILDFNTLNTNKYHSIFKIKEDEENYSKYFLLENTTTCGEGSECQWQALAIRYLLFFYINSRE